MTFDELALDLINKTNGFTELNGAYKVVSKADVQNAETILRTYYQNVDKKKLDYTNNDAEGIDYVIRFDTPLYNFDLEESIKMNEDYVIKPTYRTKGVTREDVEKYAELLGLDYETALRRWKRIQAPESNYERVLDRLEPVDEAIEKHDTLNPKLWDENNELKPEVRKKIEEIVQKFDDNLKENDVELDVKDICIIGSNANYNYSPDSDVDIHIIADTSVYPNQEDLAMKVYLAYKSLFNNKYDPMLNGIEAEIYVEPDAVKANSNGIYSLNQGWLKEPEQVDVPDIDPEHVQELVKPFEDRYNEVKVNPTIEDVDELIDDIYLQRQKSIMKDGEFGDGNICFKEFRNRGYLQDLRDLKVELENEEMSLNTFGEGVTRVFDLNDNELDLNEDIDLKAGQIFENGPEHTIEIISIDDDLVNYKEKDGNNEYEDTEYLPRLNAMLFEYGFKLAESLNEVKGVVPLDEDVWSNDNGTEFSFPNVRDTLAVYLEWEGIIGEAFLDDIMDFAEAGYDALSDYLDEEGIYGYTERIYNIFNGEPAWCSQMDEDDFVSVCRALYIDPNDAINYDDLTEDKDDVKVIFNPNVKKETEINLPGYGVEYISGYAGMGVNHIEREYFRTPEERDERVKKLEDQNVRGIKTFTSNNFYHTEVNESKDVPEATKIVLDESLNEDIKSGQRFVSPEKDEILVVDGPREDGQIRYHYEDNDGNIIDGHYTVDNYSMLNNYLKSSNFKSVDESLGEGDYLGSKRDLTRDEKKMYLRSIPKFRVIPHPGNHIHKKPFTVQSGRHYQTVDDVYKDYPKDEYDVELVEDIIKLKNGKWANKGKEGTHGEVKTKKAAREQQKAMFASGYHESLDEGTFFDSMPGYMTPEEVRAFNREKEAQAKAEKDAARAEKKAAAKEKAKAERERQKRIDQREKVNNLSYDSLADMAGLPEDNNDLTKDELLATLRASMSDEEILKLHKKMLEDYEAGIPGGPYENDDDYILDQNSDYDNGLPNPDDIPFKDDYKLTESHKGYDLIFDRDTGDRQVEYGINWIQFNTDNYSDAVRWVRQLNAAIAGDFGPGHEPSDDSKYYDPENYPKDIQEVGDGKFNFRRRRDILDSIEKVDFVDADDDIKDLDETVNSPLNEDTDFTNKAAALSEYLDVEPSDISDTPEENVFEVGDSGQEYFVGTEEEAHAKAVEEIKMLFDDMGLDSFTSSFKKWILNNAIDPDAVDEFIEQEIEYFSDEEDADLVNYLKGLNTEDEKVNYVIDTLGSDVFEDWAKDHIDMDAVAEEAIREDGVAHFIAYYDGDELDLGNRLYAYRIN